MAANQLDILAQLGGTNTTSNAGNTGALENALAQLAAQNNTGYEALLQSIFQQATAQMPGFQKAYSNSVGARSRSNSATNAALSKLLKDTTMAAQGQLVTQQNNNIGQQIQAGNAIAQATKGTQQHVGTDMGSAAKNLAIMKLLSESGLLKKNGLSDLFGGSSASSEPVDYGMVNPMDNFVARQPNYSGTTTFRDSGAAFLQPAQQTFSDFVNTIDFSGEMPSDIGFNSNDNDNTTPTFNLDDFGGGPIIPEETYIPTQEDVIDYGEYYADGGMVGRDGVSSEDAAEEADQTKFDPGHTTNRVLDILQKIINNDAKAQQSNFADGGPVTQRAAGGRRSSAPVVNRPEPTTSVADNTLPTAPVQPVVPITLTPAQPIPIEPVDIGEGGNQSPDFSGTGQMSAGMRKGLGLLGTANSLSGITGGSSIQGLGGIMGLAKARNADEALGAVASTALGIASPVAAGVFGFARKPSQVTAVDALSSLSLPTAAVNLGLGLFGTSIGQLGLGTPQSVDRKTGEVTEATMGLFGGGGEFGGNPAMSSPVTGWGNVETTDLGLLGGGTDNSAGPDTTGMGMGVNGDYADGGMPQGTEDNIPIKVSGGEYIISKDVVDAIGVDFFDALQQALHTPASIQRAMA